MNNVGQRIKNLRKQKPMSQALLAELIGVDRRTVINYEQGDTEPPLEKIESIAKVFGVSTDYIRHGKPTTTKIPVYGRVAAGIPLEAIEDVIDFEEIPQHWDNSYEYFALKITGDSMQPRMFSGDVVIVRKQDDIDSGDIGIVLINGQDATVKKVLKSESGITLQPLNYNYQPAFYTNQDVIDMPVKILGKVIELRAKY